MIERVLMPKQGNTVESCVILEWKKREGERVEAGDILCEVETDKATFEIEAEHSGVLLSILHAEGEDVPVLEEIAYIGDEGEKVPEKTAVDSQETEEAAGMPLRRKPDTGSAGNEHSGNAGDRVRISPRARNFARKHGIPVEGITGSGPGGRILEADVRKASDQPPATEPEGFPGRTTETAVEGFREVIARRMKASLSETAQLTLHASADAREILEYRGKLKGANPEGGLPGITLGDMVLFAAARVLPGFPGLNAHFLGDRIVSFEHAHIGVAVDTPRGLLVPTVRFADTLSLSGISREAERLADTARRGKAGPQDLVTGSFTVTNLGSLGIERFTPVLNPPQVAILGVCSIRREPVEEGGQIAFVPKIGLSLTIDHQAVDGAPAARFLKSLCDFITAFQVHLAE